MQYQARLIFLLFSFGLAIGLVLQTALSSQAWPRCQKLQQELVRVGIENLATKSRIEKIRLKIQNLRVRRDVQEHLIRDELGWIRKDDIIFYIK